MLPVSYGATELPDEEAFQISSPSRRPLEKRSAVVIRVTVITAALVVLSLVASIFTHQNLSSKVATSSIKLIERTTYSSLSDTEKEDLFDDFVTTYGKSYDTDEEYEYRLYVFKSNLDLADERNTAEASASGDAVHGVTKFSDLTADEFQSKYLIGAYDGQYAYTGRRLSAVDKTDAKKMYSRALKEAKTKRTRALQNKLDVVIPDGPSDGPDVDIDGPVDEEPSIADWTDLYTTPVNDQGSGCSGASWAFAAIEQIESDAIRKGVITISDTLSAQQILSCNTNSSGCAGGSVESTYMYAKRPGAIYFGADYPYTASNEDAGECLDNGSGYALTLGSYATVTKYHNEAPTAVYTTTQVEANMLAHLVATGTLHACLDASSWTTYVSGTMSSCEGTTINHCVQVVGVYFDPTTSSGYYKIRNSWGADWGDSGFMTLAHGINACDISYNPGYTDPVDCC